MATENESQLQRLRNQVLCLNQSWCYPYHIEECPFRSGDHVCCYQIKLADDESYKGFSREFRSRFEHFKESKEYHPSLEFLQLIQGKIYAIFQHHGLTAKQGSRIHFLALNRKGMLQSTPEEFSHGLPIRRCVEDPGPLLQSWQEVYSRWILMQRCPRIYNILSWNCEHFVYYLRRGQAQSFQIERFIRPIVQWTISSDPLTLLLYSILLLF